VSDNKPFVDRFLTREEVVRYRDRYVTGRRQKVDKLERAALRELLSKVGNVPVALDIPSGTGRLSTVLAEHSRRVILADLSPMMLEVAREDMAGQSADYLLTGAEKIALPDRSVDLLFSHRFLHHITDPQLRHQMLCEFARVTRRYVVISYYAQALRGYLRFRMLPWLRGSDSKKRLTSFKQFCQETADAKLRLVHRQGFRPFNLAAFCLFEKV
jgi:ubiquinone/menaquinone biosynthesis C-methylase UbiE